MTRDDVLLTILKATEAHGCVPPAKWVAELHGVDASHARRWYRRLLDEGILRQPFGEGPYVVTSPKPPP